MNLFDLFRVFSKRLLLLTVLLALDPVGAQSCDTYPSGVAASVFTCAQMQAAIACFVEEIVIMNDFVCNSETVISNRQLRTTISGNLMPMISGAPLVRLFSVRNATVSFVGLRMVGSIAMIPTSGGILSCISGSVTIDRCFMSRGSADFGGAISAESAKVDLIDSTFSNNKAGRAGGFIHAAEAVNINIVNCLINFNSAANDGGGISAIGSEVVVADSFFDNNYATNRGGTLILSTANMVMSNTSLTSSRTGSSAAFRGGSVFASSSTLRFSGLVCRNSSGSEGHFMYLTESETTIEDAVFIGGKGAIGIVVKSQWSVLNLTSSEMSLSRASDVAGVSCGAETRCILVNSTFTGNYASSGAVVQFDAASEAIVENCTFSHNIVDSSGCLSMLRVRGAHVRNTMFFSNEARKSGGAIYTLDSTGVQVHKSTFFDNIAGTGGAACIESLSNVSFFDCQFSSNSAMESAGAINVNDNSVASLFGSRLLNHDAIVGGAVTVDYASKFSFLSSEARRNTALYNGGVFAIDGLSTVIIRDSELTDNKAQDGGVADLSVASNIVVERSKLFRNKANFAGGVISTTDDVDVVVNDSEFINNTATFSGGVFNIFKTKLLARNSTFVNNFAFVDGAVLTATVSDTQFEHNLLVDNIAYRGGCFYLSLESELRSAWSDILRNKGAFGGVMYVTSTSAWTSVNDSIIGNVGTIVGGVTNGEAFALVKHVNCEVSGNTAIVGSIAALSKGNSVVIVGSVFSNNFAFLYGGLELQFTSLDMSSCYFIGNSANGRGPSISISGSSTQNTLFGVIYYTIDIRNSTFMNNTIVETFSDDFSDVFEGAAISFSSCRYGTVTNSTFIGNSAQYGGAIFSIGSTVNISGSSFIENRARFGGGAIYWQVNLADRVSAVFISPNTVETGNRAAFGNFAATNTYRISIVQAPSVITSGQQISGPFKIALLDIYNQVVEYEDSGDKNIVYLLTNDSARSSIQGKTVVEAVNGYAIFDSLIITYFANSLLSLKFDLLDVPSVFYPIRFRSCIYGEINEQLSSGNIVCTVCSPGFYSLALGATKCIGCPDNAECPGGNVIDVNKGYWRVNQFSDNVLKCPLKDACLGGINAWDQCRSGHKGKYCDVCDDGYVRSADATCRRCSDDSFIAVAIVLPIIFGLLFFVFVVATVHSEKIKLFLSNQILILADKAEKYNLSSLRTKVKIMVTFVQILSQMPSVFGALFPEGYLNFLNFFGFFNFSISSFLSLGCVIDSDYHSDLLTATIGPAVLLILVAIGLLIKKAVTRNSFDPYHMAEMRKDMLTATLMISFFIFSPVSITIFEAFTCEEFDDGSNMLVADYSIDCDSKVHLYYEIYAGLMIFVYPIGIPAFYFYLLLKNHKYVNPSAALVVREDEKRLVDRRIIQAEKTKLRETYKEIWHLSFLYENYAPKRWYFEVLDCFRRLFLTAIPVLVLRGTSVQLLLVLMASLVWCIIYMQLKPFEMPNDNIIAIMSQWAISFTLIGGVMLKVSADEQDAQYYVIDVLLILINVGVILTTIYIATTMEDDDILEELAKDAKRQKQKYGKGDDSDDDTVYRKQNTRAVGEVQMSRKASIAIESRPENTSNVENPIHANDKRLNSAENKPTRRASALGSQLFSTAQMKRSSVTNASPGTTDEQEVSGGKDAPKKRGSVLDRLRGAGTKKRAARRSSQAEATPDSDDDDTPASNSFSARVGRPVAANNSNDSNHTPFADGGSLQTKGRNRDRRRGELDSDDEQEY